VSTRHAKILSTGLYTPEVVIDNEELIRRFNLSVDPAWIEECTGIRSRHWMPPGQTTSDMAVEAARGILEEAGVEPRTLDRIILATISPDYISPATATVLARKLGARCPAFDISAACAGFIYGLDLGAAAIRGGEERVLVLAADARSRFIDTSDVRSVVLFADGAAGALLVPAAEPGVEGVWLGAEGREDMGAHIPAGGAALPTSVETVAAGKHFLQVDSKREIFNLFVTYTREAVEGVLALTGISLDEIDLFITHQGNARMVEEVLADLKIPSERAMNSIALHGNTSGATVPMALAEALRDGRVGPGDRVLLTAVGAGYTFGAAVCRF
jgi:3-oxoacyl-[acyl-carrier-protein] synthase-3